MSELNIDEDAQSGPEYSGSQSSNNEDQGPSQPTESAFPDEDEETITMLDVIEGEDKLEEEDMERALSALNRMNRAAVVEALHGYDELKADLSEYLRKFADTKKVVREEDIHEFFQQLKSKKRQKLEHPEC